jgi:DNA topoisomerase-1
VSLYLILTAFENFLIKTFNDSDIQVLNGRFGPYIWNGKNNGKGQKTITIKKVFGDKIPADLTLEECKKAVSGKLKPKAKPKKRKKVARK